MIIESLELEAFGSFKKRQFINFLKASKSKIFLLSGPSGAGKTTILDAIFYALYGTLPGNRSSVDPVKYKNSFSLGEIIPYVEIVFRHKDKKYCLKRCPSFLRPKKKGDGFVIESQNASLKCWNIDNWKTITYGSLETTQKVTQLLNLDSGQFSQIILLPQGHFDSFLRSKPDKRKELLQKIFPVNMYKNVIQWFEKEKDISKKYTEKTVKEWWKIVDQSTALMQQLGEFTDKFEFKKVSPEKPPSNRRISFEFAISYKNFTNKNCS